MAEAGKVTLERLNREVERIGSLLRSMNVQIDAIRTRVTDLEHLEKIAGKGSKIAFRTDNTLGDGDGWLKAAGKTPGQDDEFDDGKGGGQDNGSQTGRKAGKDNGGKGKGKGQGKPAKK
jgi:hypothetical protein